MTGPDAPVQAVVVPMTPLLLRDLGGQQDPVADLREACVRAVRELAAAHDRLVALCPVGPGAPAAYHHGGTAGPLSVLVARHLLSLAGADVPVDLVEVDGPVDAPADAPEDAPARRGLLVLGEGSARRTEGGPGHVDDRAPDFDEALCAALEAGDGAALAGLDQDLAADLLVTGRHTLAALGAALPRASGEVRWQGHPFGVTYLVAVWRRGDDGDFGTALPAVYSDSSFGPFSSVGRASPW